MQPIKGEPTNPIVDVCCCKYFLPTLNPLVILNQCVISIPTQPSVGYFIILLTHSFVVHFWWTDLGGGSHQQITHELSSFKGDGLLTRAIPFRFCICFCFCLRIYLFSKRSSFGWWWVGGILRCHDMEVSQESSLATRLNDVGRWLIKEVMNWTGWSFSSLLMWKLQYCPPFRTLGLNLA